MSLQVALLLFDDFAVLLASVCSKENLDGHDISNPITVRPVSECDCNDFK